MTSDDDAAGSHLFLLRVWAARDGSTPGEWCGRLQGVVSGEVRGFQGSAALAEALRSLAGMPAPATDDRDNATEEQR
ncbi:MAG TPA: hypothetical protein VM536_22965 [Chloroflexia bacterium]|nr:hypothetical protein [Chloroflexia bacterium]